MKLENGLPIASDIGSSAGKEYEDMGIFLNSPAAFVLYESEVKNPYFVDKSMLLTELFPLVEQGNNHICITRPRRFGKTVMANMIGAFFCRKVDSSSLFDSLKIAKEAGYWEHLNQQDVIYIDFSKLPRNCKSYEQYIHRIESLLINDICEEYPNVMIDTTGAVWDVLETVFLKAGMRRFIFVLDEWDSIFHKDFVTDKDKAAFIDFLSNLLKGKPYVLLTYMTGILPIAKYSSGSELNMFLEYTMTTEEKFSDDFGFTETEVDMLFERYLVRTENPQITREGLREWYDGYYTKAGERMYNPRSVVAALSNNNLGNYWTSSGPYDEIFYYIRKNIDDICNDLALMVAGESVVAKVREYAAVSMNLSTRDEIFSAMVVYGFLSYKDGKVCIPNKELMDRFDDMLQRKTELGYVHQLAKQSEKMLNATLAGDTTMMANILSFAHNTETPILSYNNEVELSAIVNLVYLAARDRYRVEREDKAGIGYVDFIFYPYKKSEDCIILELKVNHTPEDAIQQIKDKNYALRFKGKLGENERYTGRILAVGMSYYKDRKVHQCKIEVL